MGQGHSRLMGLLDHALLIFSAITTPALHSQYLDFGHRHNTRPGHVSYSCCLDIRPVLSSRGLIHRIRRSPVVVELEPEEALRRMLEATGLTFRFVTDHSVTIKAPDEEELPPLLDFMISPGDAARTLP